MPEQGICQGCGDNSSLTPDGYCIRCVIGDGEVPALKPRAISEDEIDRILERLRFRMVGGREKYEGSYLQADLKADLEEELLDAAAYHLLMVDRIQKVLVNFSGPTSNELKRARR